ncbi:MAG: response regulator [Terracidiphilus sp.]
MSASRPTAAPLFATVESVLAGTDMSSFPQNGNGAAARFLPNRAAACILLSVNDEPGILFTRQAVLEMAGYKVLMAANGPQALENLEAHPVDLVVLDDRMPGIDGAAVAREIKRRKPQVPVILVSGWLVDGHSQAPTDRSLCAEEGPALLLSEIERLLAATKMPPRSDGAL